MEIFKSIWSAGTHRLEYGNRTLVMGILNVTPDSFSDGGAYATVEKAVGRALIIVQEGGDIIDIGAQSTRPGYVEITAEEELERLLPVLIAVRKEVELPISIDTYYPQVAHATLAHGADIINDVSGLADPEMLDVLKKSNAGYILMHCNPAVSIKAFFEEVCERLIKCGISRERICLDPGIGFGKSVEECFDVLRNLTSLCCKEYPMLVGCSRKRMVGAPCGNPPFDQRLPGTIAAHTASILGGANIIRVHDVAESVQAARVTDKLRYSMV